MLAAPERPLEICTTMIGPPISWGYLKDPEVPHKSADEIWEALRQVGERLRKDGFPEA